MIYPKFRLLIALFAVQEAQAEQQEGAAMCGQCGRRPGAATSLRL